MQRSKAIDVLRAIAVVLVLGRHMTPCPESASSGWHTLTSIWQRGGWIGVDLFFVLSGFLVSGLLFKEFTRTGTIAAGRFLIRRGFKIYPAFYVMIGASVFLDWRHQAFHLENILPEIFFVQNYFPCRWNHTWSLAVEEHFYFLLLIFLVWCSKRGGDRTFAPVPAAFALVAGLCLALRIWTSAHGPYIHIQNLMPTHLRIDSLFFGVLLSYFYNRNQAAYVAKVQVWRWPLVVLGCLALAPAFFVEIEKTPYLYTFGYLLHYLGAGALLSVLVATPVFERPWFGGIAYVGSHSYSIYLWHMPLSSWVIPVLAHRFGERWNWFAYFGVYFLGSIVLGIVLANIIEYPALRLRDRLFPSKVRAMSTAPIPAAA
jgi:peptidoglycan/LPS O-acetylase OafA/YrhL